MRTCRAWRFGKPSWTTAIVAELAAATCLTAIALREVDLYPACNTTVLSLSLGMSLALSGWLAFQKDPPSDVAPECPRRLLRLTPGCNLWAIVLFLSAGLAWLMLDFRLDDFYGTPDTAQYTRMAVAPIASDAFLVGERPFGLPLALKVFGVTPSSGIFPFSSPEIRRFAQFQTVLSLASFVLLGFATAAHLQNRLLKTSAAIWGVGQAAVIDVAQWNRMILSESLAISLLALALGIALFGAWLSVRWPAARAGTRAFGTILLGLVIFLFSNTRDANAYVVLAAGVLLLLLAGVMWFIFRRVPHLHLLLGMWMIAVSLAQMGQAARGERWFVPLCNILRLRIVPDSEARAYFVEHGAPLADTADEIMHIACVSDDCRAFCRDYLTGTRHGAELLAWMTNAGRSIYARYLFARTERSLVAPLMDLERLLNPDSTEYRTRVHTEPSLFPTIRSILFPRPSALVIDWAMLLLPPLGFMLAVPSMRHGAAIVLALLVLTYPHMFTVWHGDAVEIERHSTLVAIQIRLALWMGTLLVLDLVLLRLKRGDRRTIG